MSAVVVRGERPSAVREEFSRAYIGTRVPPREDCMWRCLRSNEQLRV